MAKHKGDIEIGRRANEEVYRVFGNYRKAARLIGCDYRLINSWMHGNTPGGHFLARMHYLGCDVLYILTGKRHKQTVADCRGVDNG